MTKGKSKRCKKTIDYGKVKSGAVSWFWRRELEKPYSQIKDSHSNMEAMKLSSRTEEKEAP